MNTYFKPITIEDMNNILKDFPNLNYPKQCNKNLYEISKGVFTNEKGLKEFKKELLNYGK